jgi:1-hydroxycarotenoid 3,4-desaturase
MPPSAAHAMTSRPVVVIGAGIGGLACALELAARGTEVGLVERADAVGGKLREVEVGGRRLDAGPTVFTMRWVFDELFDAAGAQLDDHLRLAPAETLARHAWDGEATFDLFADLDRSVDAIGAFSGAAEAQRYVAFCKRAGEVYRALEGPFLRSQRPNPVSLMTRAGWRGLPAMLRISPFATLWSALGEHFHDPRLRQLFGRYATYCGASPFLAPATLMLVAHVEREGVWLVEGGMQRIATALADLAVARGARLRCGAHVSEIVVRDGRARAVRLGSGEVIEAEAIVFNGDSAALAGGLLGVACATALPRRVAGQRSLSALTWNLVGRAGGFELLRHNVFFGADSAREFEDLFMRRTLPAAPTVYVCAQDRDAEGRAPHDPAERLFCLVNAPATTGADTIDPKEIERCETRMFQTLARCGLTITPESPPVLTTPAEFARRFPGSGGALYGAASHGWKASFTRPGSRCRIPGLYLAGGTTHPGPGVPMAALSGRLAAASLMADRAAGRSSTSRWRPAAMPGGTSTR